MKNDLYTNNSVKKYYDVLGNNSKSILSLFELNVDDYKFTNKSIFYLEYCNSIKSILELNKLPSIIERIYILEEILNKISSKNLDLLLLPNLKKFHVRLSKTMLKIFLDHDRLELSIGSDDIENERLEIKQDIIEGIRLLLEEEIYFWQDKVI